MEAYLTGRLSEIGLPCYKYIPDHRIGMPDRLVLLPDGRCLWVELKTVGGELSIVQKLRHKELRRYGQEVVTVWTKAEADALVQRLRERQLWSEE